MSLRSAQQESSEQGPDGIIYHRNRRFTRDLPDDSELPELENRDNLCLDGLTLPGLDVCILYNNSLSGPTPSGLFLDLEYGHIYDDSNILIRRSLESRHVVLENRKNRRHIGVRAEFANGSVGNYLIVSRQNVRTLEEQRHILESKKADPSDAARRRKERREVRQSLASQRKGGDHR